MYCESCGNFVPDGQAFCANCGAPQPKTSAPVTQAAPVAAQPVVQQVAQPVQQAQPVYQQPVYQQPVVQQPVVQPVVQPVYQQPVYTSPAPTVIVQQPAVVAAAKEPVKPTNSQATAGLVFGILTVVFCWTSFFCGIFGLLGLIFSIIGLCRKRAPGKGKAIAGLVLTIIGSILAVVLTNLIWASIGLAWESFLYELENEIEADYYSTSYSDSGLDSGEYYINGDFATTDKGYVSGVLHIDGFIVEF